MPPREYHYLIAGLPDLVVEQTRPPLTLAAFRELLVTHLHPEDYRLMQYLFWADDNRNLLTLLLQKDRPWAANAIYTRDELTDALRDPADLPPYMQRFIAAYQEELPIRGNSSWENQLTELYYDAVLSQTTGFLNDWFTFDRDLRNLLAALSARRHQIPLEGQLIGDYALAKALLTNHARDFGVGGEYPYLERLIQWEDNTWWEREMAIDAIRWRYLDELNAFNYFSVEVVLAYWIRLTTIERWIPLDGMDGYTAFRQLIDGLETHISFTSEFALT